MSRVCIYVWLSQSLPSSIGHMRKLKTLKAQGNLLDHIPGELRDVRGLQVCDLDVYGGT
jgi:Leucine-rich repeat (LRR) protein